VEALKFETSSILIPLLCGLNNHGIIGSVSTGGRFLIINLIEKGYLLVIGYPMIFYILHSLLTMQIDGAVIGVSYSILGLHSKLGVAFNVIHGMHQPNMTLKTYFLSIT
jgi:hypothetical protein